MSVNDVYLDRYHRINGITSLRVWDSSGENYINIIKVKEGILWSMDVFNKAYFKQFIKNVEIIAATQFMPFEIDLNKESDNLMNVCGLFLYPMALSLLMPLFMYNIVLEKESQLIEIMKINGMKMRYYWLSYFILYYGIYALTMGTFCIIGGYVFGFVMFARTSTMLLVNIS
jgi:hypothetical protein